MECRLHLPARSPGTRAEREVHRPADLLVEERVAGELAHRMVEPERELAGPPGAVVERQHLAQERALARPRLDHLAGTELEFDAAHAPARVARRVAEADLAVDLRLDRAGEDLAVGEVLAAVAGDPRPPLDTEREVGAVADNADLPPLLEPGSASSA